ncbi:MAG: Rne/Rng family ribonuclease [Proteobacteria bacterium]|nr:Rne/Rng family ribonuclease [Cystobacterineae bacterium]MCL2258712.1 Rne/Rng family ribonuclease [Cystobacterineae bacterium]MCL2315002.1 Rne/Rng family ribonuclease [Pseudomonadota bacterium]
MSSVLIINATGRETRVALVENGHISEFYLERKKDKGIVGNIYKGKVTRVLPGMQAAFVDIGIGKAAFLYVNDVFYDPEFSKFHYELTEGESDEEVADVPEEPEELAQEEPVILEFSPEGQQAELLGLSGVAAEISATSLEESPLGQEPLVLDAGEAEGEGVAEGGAGVPTGAEVIAATLGEAPPLSEEEVQLRILERRAGFRVFEERRSRRTAKIEELLQVGQEVLVQISKDPIGTKGARLTSHISIPGRHLVFMPTVDHVGISRRIGNDKERRRLREIVERLRPPGTGFIVRTVAENVTQEKLEADIRFLLEVWKGTLRENEARKTPGLLHPDLDLILRATRDLFARDVERLVIDDRDEYMRVLHFVSAQDAALRERVSLHENGEPIFDAYGIEEEIKRAQQRKVWLKSGGYLIFDQAEALTAVDVNSGRYVGKKSLEETITKINVEAAKEIVYQLRLRNIGGIIICDFIDMEKSQNRDKVFKALQEALGRDKAKTNVLRISELGLVEMTRKRVRESIGRVVYEDCGYCDGQGYVKTISTVAYEIFRELRRSTSALKDPTLVIHCNMDVASLLLGEERGELRHLMDRLNKSIYVRGQHNYHREQYDIYARSTLGPEHRIASSREHLENAGSYGAPKPSRHSESRHSESRHSESRHSESRHAEGRSSEGHERGAKRSSNRERSRKDSRKPSRRPGEGRVVEERAAHKERIKERDEEGGEASYE